ncbi:archaeal/vacuolar-type H+-ATPase subunit E [Thermoplasmatales archaeon SCGC AB-540-F20]|nr:archaeal/vacuolar-type H+-ATPase subunit E [Thermoplasmatales archaeon SCGC AB-540-F20]
MTAEKILEQIKKDSEKEINQILKEAEKQTASIIDIARKEAEVESEKILSRGKNQSENIKKILVSKASQDAKREIMKAREKIIEECFAKAQRRLSTFKEAEYKKIVTKLMEDGRKKLDGQCTIVVSRDIDRNIAKSMGLKVTGTVEASGGVILKSGDGGITLNNTFEGILKRKKDEIRIKVGKLLFSK